MQNGREIIGKTERKNTHIKTMEAYKAVNVITDF
jgi:hypothetical protein